MSANIPIVNYTIEENKSDKVLLYGAGGVGKSASLATLFINAPEDRRLIYLMTERNAASGFEFGLKHYNINIKEGQVIYVFPENKKKAFIDITRAVTAFTKQSKSEALSGNSKSTQGKEHYTYLQKILGQLENFSGTDFVTGESIHIGNVGDLKSSDILAIDGLSPIANEIWNSTMGDKIAIAMQDYMTPQRLMYTILAELSKLVCPVILLAHEKPMVDDNGNVQQIVVNTWVGNSNYESLMGLFTDVIRAVKTQTGYKWEVNAPKTYTILRKIPKTVQKVIEPNFSDYDFFK